MNLIYFPIACCSAQWFVCPPEELLRMDKHLTWSVCARPNQNWLKGYKWSSILNFTFFQTPRFFLNIQKELHCNKLPIQQLSRKQHIFGRETIFLGGGELIIIQASVSRKKTFKSWFSEVLMYFSIRDSNTYLKKKKKKKKKTIILLFKGV